MVKEGSADSKEATGQGAPGDLVGAKGGAH